MGLSHSYIGRQTNIMVPHHQYLIASFYAEARLDEDGEEKLVPIDMQHR